MPDLSLIKKVDDYYSDIEKIRGVIPRSRFGAKAGAILSYIIWGTSFSEYFGYRFWERFIKDKKEYMTRRHMFKFFDTYNPPEFRQRIGDKSIAPKYYGEFLSREQIDKNVCIEAFSDF